MPNVMFTSHCNRSCPYCFAGRRVEHNRAEARREDGNLTIEGLEYVKRFLQESGERLFSIIGGEPTLHPQFEGFVDSILEGGFRIRMFSNGIIPERRLEYLSDVPPDRLDILLNVNERAFMPRQELDAVVRTLEKIPFLCTLGLNIYRPDFDPSLHLEWMQRFGLRRFLRIAFAQPIVGMDTAYLRVEDYPLVARRIVEWARRLDAENVQLNFDCGFPLCVFEEGEVGALTLAGSHLQAVCDPIIDIGPDLSVWHCFPLTGYRPVSLRDFRNLGEVIEHFHRTVADVRRGVYSICADCRYFQRGQCRGGCMAHVIGDGKTRPAPPDGVESRVLPPARACAPGQA